MIEPGRVHQVFLTLERGPGGKVALALARADEVTG